MCVRVCVYVYEWIVWKWGWETWGKESSVKTIQ